MISTVDKALPQSPFKEIFRAAWYQGEGQYKPIFLPWYTRPERTRAWYDAIALDMFKQTNSSDNLWQEYPETVEQALAPLQLAKRIPFAWLDNTLDGWLRAHFGISSGLLFSGTLAALLFAYVVRFLTASLQAVETGLVKIRPAMDDSARTLGYRPAQILRGAGVVEVQVVGAAGVGG